MTENAATVGEAGITPEGKARLSHEALAEFVVSMIQAFLRTGYYLPGHPESLRAKEGLHEKFHALTETSGELTFLLRKEGEKETVFLEGLSPRPLELADMMVKGMAETYNPRFVTYLKRKDLLSLSLGSKMDSREFSNFVDIMSEPSLADMHGSDSKESFARHLRDRGVSHLSYVFDEDFITSRRNIPWRAALAISRLRKDLRVIPIFRRLGPDELAPLRREILSDILRPITDPDLLYAFLMNMDLAASEELGEDEAEKELLSSVGPAAVTKMAAIFVEDAGGKKSLYCDKVGGEKRGRILDRLAHYLNLAGTPEAGRGLEEMFTSGLLPLDDLPEEVRERIMSRRIMQGYLERGDAIIELFEGTSSPPDYSRQALSLARIVPHLLEGGHVREVLPIVEKLSAHEAESSGRAPAARAALVHLMENNSLEIAGRIFLEAPKEERLLVEKFFGCFGGRAVPHLLDIVAGSGDQWRRKQAAEILCQMGPEGKAELLSAMEGRELPPETTGTLLHVLSATADEIFRPTILQAAGEHLASENPEVRREALTALWRLDPGGSGGFARDLLGDPDPEVRKQAIRGLGTAEGDGFFEALRPFVEGAEGEVEAEAWDLAASAVEALGRRHDLEGDDQEKIARYLVEIGEGRFPKGRLRRLVGRPEAPLPFLLSLADALASIPGEPPRELLGRMTAARDKALSRRANAHLKKREVGDD